MIYSFISTKPFPTSKKKKKNSLLLIVSIYVAPFPLKNFIDCASKSPYLSEKSISHKVQMCLTGHHWITGGSKIDDIYIYINVSNWMVTWKGDGYNSGSNSVLFWNLAL